MLRWFGHVERMNGENMKKKKYNSGDEEGRGWSCISFECIRGELGAGESDSA